MRLMDSIYITITAFIMFFCCSCNKKGNNPAPNNVEMTVDTIVRGRTFVTDATTGKTAEGYVKFHFVGKTENGMLVNGIATYENGDVYTGHFANVAREDTSATLRLHNGDKYKGSFYNNMYKKGTYTISSGEYFSGTFQNNRPYNGTWYDADGNVSIKVINGEILTSKKQ